MQAHSSHDGDLLLGNHQLNFSTPSEPRGVLDDLIVACNMPSRKLDSQDKIPHRHAAKWLTRLGRQTGVEPTA
jgi:hypothetical protein